MRWLKRLFCAHNYLPPTLTATLRVRLPNNYTAIVPRTELGRELLRLRHAYIAGGGRLLSGDALDAERRR